MQASRLVLTALLQRLFVDGELDVFVDDQQSAWLAGVNANPLQTEFAES